MVSPVTHRQNISVPLLPYSNLRDVWRKGCGQYSGHTYKRDDFFGRRPTVQLSDIFKKRVWQRATEGILFPTYYMNELGELDLLDCDQYAIYTYKTANEQNLLRSYLYESRNMIRLKCGLLFLATPTIGLLADDRMEVGDKIEHFIKSKIDPIQNKIRLSYLILEPLKYILTLAGLLVGTTIYKVIRVVRSLVMWFVPDKYLDKVVAERFISNKNPRIAQLREDLKKLLPFRLYRFFENFVMTFVHLAKGEFKEAGERFLQFIFYPLFILGMTLAALYGIIDPLNGRYIYSILETYTLCGDDPYKVFLAPCFQPNSINHFEDFLN